LIDEFVYSNLISITENEMDWPQMSYTTGYMNTTWAGAPEGPVDSAYLRISQRNLCSHRDYQNIAVNGADSNIVNATVMHTIARNQSTDYPTFFVLELLGNDVCGGYPSQMTTPQQFYKNIMSILTYLDSILVSGSHIAVIGLIDGRVLYETMSERIHPIGSWKNDVTYSQFYDYLNCLEISPCFGYMNTDSNWRNSTYERTAELNQVYRDLIANNTFKNFDITFFEAPMNEIIALWHSMGGETFQLIEPVDGFHPTQLSNALTSLVMIKHYEKANIVPPINPHNNLIKKLFGDQGGYFPHL